MTNLSQVMRDYYARVDKSIEETREPLRHHLLTIGVVEVKAFYAGYGDEGCIETVKTTPESICLDHPLPTRDKKEHSFSSVETAGEFLEELIYDILSKFHGGWENNDGADGDFLWLLKDDAITLSHRAFYTDSECSETEL